jgi:putative transposase
VDLDEWIVMPNHVHGIIIVLDDRLRPSANHVRSTGSVGADHDPPLPPQASPGSLGVIVRQFKGAVTRNITVLRRTPGAPVWQRNYYERVIRNGRELNAIREYIIGNPTNWSDDPEHPDKHAR